MFRYLHWVKDKTRNKIQSFAVKAQRAWLGRTDLPSQQRWNGNSFYNETLCCFSPHFKAKKTIWIEIEASLLLIVSFYKCEQHVLCIHTVHMFPLCSVHHLSPWWGLQSLNINEVSRGGRHSSDWMNEKELRSHWLRRTAEESGNIAANAKWKHINCVSQPDQHLRA